MTLTETGMKAGDIVILREDDGCDYGLPGRFTAGSLLRLAQKSSNSKTFLIDCEGSYGVHVDWVSPIPDGTLLRYNDGLYLIRGGSPIEMPPFEGPNEILTPPLLDNDESVDWDNLRYFRWRGGEGYGKQFKSKQELLQWLWTR